MPRETSINDFGLLIAYVIPGYTALWGLWLLFPDAVPIPLASGVPSLNVAGFLYSTVAAVAAGLTVSTVRWMVIDPIHHATGLPMPNWDFAELRESAVAFEIVVEHYYRYYQFAANTLVSLLFVLAVRLASGFPSPSLHWIDLHLIELCVVFFVSSRGSLRRYYTRGGQLLQNRRAAANTDRP
jgi:hypothetical protein